MNSPTPFTFVERFDIKSGRWLPVPAVDVNGTNAVVTGRWIKTAAIDAEECVEAELANPDLFIDVLARHRRAGLKVDLFTFAQKLPHFTPKYAYPWEPESVAVIRLNSFSEWWNSLPQESRKNVRRAAKRGLELRRESVNDEVVRGIVEINNETPIRQGRNFGHFGESFDEVKRDFLAFEHRSDLICAYDGQELVGLVKIIYCGQVAAIMKLQTKISHADKRPANALLSAAVERCHQRGFTYVTYGLYRYGNQKWTSLMQFKARHGFEEIIVPRYYVPLSAKGRLSAKLRLHRGIVGLLPPKLVEVARAVRARSTSGHLAGVAQR